MVRPNHNPSQFMLGLLFLSIVFVAPLFKYESNIIPITKCVNDEPTQQQKPLKEHGSDSVPVEKTNNSIDIDKKLVQEQKKTFPPSNNSTGPKPFVVCTYLRGNKKKYLIGTIVLLESVRATNANNTNTAISNSIDVRTAVVCHESVNNGTRSLLRKLGHDVIVVEDVDIDNKTLPTNRFKLLIQKYAVFDLVQYEKALFADSDAFLLKPDNLKTLFGMLDDDENSSFNKPVDIKYSIMKQLNLSNAYNETEVSYGRGEKSNATNTSATTPTSSVRKKRKVFMAPDYGRDNFNSGLMLYKPQQGMFADFQRFLEESVLPLEERKRGRLARSTQRLLQEFLFLPTTAYDLYNFCPKSNPSKCWSVKCDCAVHIFPQALDCKKKTTTGVVGRRNACTFCRKHARL